MDNHLEFQMAYQTDVMLDLWMDNLRGVSRVQTMAMPMANRMVLELVLVMVNHLDSMRVVWRGPLRDSWRGCHLDN